MKSNHSLTKRLVAYVLLLSLFLQSCLNSPIPPANPKHTGPARTTPLCTNKKDKNGTTLDLSNTTSRSDEAMKDQDDLAAASLLLGPPTNPSYVTDKNVQKPDADLSREYPLQIIPAQNDAQPVNNDHVLLSYPSPLHDNNYSIARFVKQQPTHIDTSGQLQQARFKKDNLHTPYKQLATNQKSAKASREAGEINKVEKYEKEFSSQVSLKKMDTFSPINHSISSELIEQLSRKAFTAKGGHRVTFEWVDGQCIAHVEEKLTVGFITKHHLPVYLLPGITWGKLASMNESEQKYHIQVVWKRERRRAHLLIGGLGLMGGMMNSHNYTSYCYIVDDLEVNIADQYGYTPLHRAIEKQDLSLVRQLISKRADINKKESNHGNTPLHLAVATGNIAIVKELVDSRADRSHINKLGHTILHVATMHDKTEIARYLISLGTDLNAITNNDSSTAFHMAIEKGNIEITKNLLTAGANQYLENIRKFTPIELASANGHLEYIKQIFESCKEKINTLNRDGITHLFRAIQSGNLMLVKALIEAGADKNIKIVRGKTPLHFAVEHEQIAIIQYLVNSGANKDTPNNIDLTPVHLALQKYNRPLFKQLLSALSVNLNEKDNNGKTLLHRVIAERKIDLAMQLIEIGADINTIDQDGTTPLHMAVIGGYTELARKLIAKQADKNAKDKNANTALHHAALNGQTGIIKLLIDSYVHKDAKNNDGNTPLHLAVQKQILTVVEQLVHTGADKNIKNNNGETALSLALKNSHSSDFQQLLNALKINIHEKDSNGNTLLHQAVIDGDETLVRQLISLNLIDKNIKNSFDKSPLHLAIEKGNTRLTSVLIDLKVDKDIQDSSGNTSLHLAVQAGNATMLAQLINSGVNKDSRNNLGYTPLHLAVTCKQYALAVKLKEKGANLHSTDNKGNIPLHIAIATDYWELAKYLAQAGTSLHYKNSLGLTPIELAANNGRMENIRQIFEISGININLRGNDGLTHLERAIQAKNLPLIKQLTTSHADINLKNSSGRISLHLAIEQEDVATIQHLVACGANKHIADNDGITPVQLALQKAKHPFFPQIVSALGININEKDSNDQTLLHRTIEEGNLVLVKQLVQAGANIDVKDKDGNTLLHRAILSGNETLVQQLLGMKADQNAKNNAQEAPLHLAVLQDNLAMVELLLVAEVDKNTKDQNGNTPLHLAVQQGHLAIVKKLTAQGADTNATNNKGKIPLQLALKNKGEPLAKQLLDALGADIHTKDKNGNTLLHRAVLDKNLELVKKLITSKADKNPINKEGKTPLYYAVELAQQEIVKTLLEAGADQDFKDEAENTLLHIAIHKGHTEIAEYLVKAGADLHVSGAKGLTPIDRLSKSDNLDMLKKIFRSDVNINAKGKDGLTHLHRAVKRGDKKLAKELIKLGADIKVQDKTSQTPLHLAVKKGNLKMVNLLIELGADKNSSVDHGYTTLHVAVEKGNLEIIKQLILLGADENARNSFGITLLHVAAFDRKIEVVKYLISRGVDLNSQTEDGTTPLQAAIVEANKKSLEIVRCLLAAGANPNIKDKIDGDTALHLAIEWGSIEMIKLLIDSGADINATNDGKTTPLYRAVLKGNVEIVKLLIDSGANDNNPDYNGDTLLHIAVKGGNLPIVKQLLVLSCLDLHTTNEEGFTPIDLASQTNHIEYIQEIFSASTTSINCTGADGLTHLHRAIKRKDKKLVEKLIKLGADANATTDKIGQTPLHIAVKNGNKKLALTLLKAGGNLHATNNQGLTPIDKASIRGHLDMFNDLFQSGVNINATGKDGLTHLHRAVQRNDKKLVKQLIAHGADVKLTDPTGKAPIHYAAAKGHAKLLKHLPTTDLNPKSFWHSLLKSNTISIDSPDKQGCTPLHLAAENGHTKTATLLLQQNADPYAKDNNGLTPIHRALAAQQIELIKALLKIPDFSPLECAIENNDINLVKGLVAAGVDINTINNAGKSVLYVAFEKGYMELTQELIRLGAQVNAKDNEGRSLLHHTVINGQLPVTNALLAAGADVNLADKQGLTSLHLAAQHNQSEIAQQLIAHGAHVNAKDKQQMSPLHHAAQNGHVAVGIILIQAGANLQAIDAKQNTPLSYALQNGNLSAVSLLAATNEYTLHIRRCMNSARRQVALPKDLNNQSMNQEEQQGMLDDFLAAHMGTLSPIDQQKFLKNIVPLLHKQLMQTPWKVQHKLINYFQENGNFYINILQDFGVQNWIKESLIMDIGQEGWANHNEILFTKFKESILPIVESYPDDQLEQLLFALKERQQMHQLSLVTICDIIRYLSVLEPQQALEHLELLDTAWLDSLRLAWLDKKTKQLHPTFSLSQCSQLSYALAQSTWSSDILERFITGLETEANFHDVAELIAFLAKTQPDPHILLMAFYKKPSPTIPSVARTWRHYIGCELLKNKLAHLFPIHTQALEARITKLLTNHWVYEEIDSTLGKLKTKSSNDANIEAYRLIDALDLLVEYTVKKSPCKQVLVDILQKKPSKDWEKEIHPLVIAAIFGASHERNVKEIIDYIAEKSPNTPFANDKEALQASYQDILAAYQKPATLSSTNKTPISQWDQSAVTEWAIQVKGSTVLSTMSPVTQAEVLAVVKRAVELTHQHSPRATQLLALLVFLNHVPGKGRLAQINTGEGKSLIVAMLAAIHALQGKKVDVVTTSTELSIPEVKKQSKFFNLLGLTVGENSIEEQKKEVYTRDIVYGTAANFQGDILKTEFSGKDIRGTRGFGVVIVDEVDSMLFDSRHASIRLSSQTPAMHHLEMLLGAVYSQVSKTLRHLLEKDGQTYYINEDFEIQDGKIIFLNTNEEIQEASMEPISDKEGFIKQVAQNHLESLLRPLYGAERKDWDDHKAHHAKIVKASIELDCEEDEKKREEKAKRCEELAQQAEDLAWKKNNRSPVIEIPRHLEAFANKQIPNWAHSAIQAICFFKKELHYDVRDGRIVPIDYENTGVLQDKMVWSDGLAQMLQIKEGLRVEPENISTNFISVPEFFKRYGNAIYGLTGTLGNEPTHHFLSEVYGADRVIMPPYKHIPIAGNEQSKYICKELPAIIVPTPKEWYEAICRTNLSKARNQRAVLIICKYIDQVNKIAKQLKEHHDPTKIFTYTGQEEFNKEDIDEGEIIIATNIAGRGTDITTTPMVEQTGGLHVCITFLPDSYRVELQNAGRTARQGKQGTAQLIIHDNNNQTIDELKALRDSKEETAINRAKHDVKDMLFRDRLFSRFCALESEILPTTEDCDKEAQLRKLWLTFDREYKKYLAPGGELDRIYQVEILEEAKSILYERYKQQTASPSTAEIKELSLILQKLKSELSKKHDKAALIPQLKQQLVEKICALAKGKYANDVIEHFRNARTTLPTHPELASQNDRKEIDTMSPFGNRQNSSFMNSESATKSTHDWGKHERSGIEETWGLWLQHAFKDKDAADEAAVWKSFDRLSDDIWRDAKNNYLIKNPYYYILKGNDLLFGQNTTKAIAAYDRAIGLDKLHSVNAYYNKAKALLRPKENKDNISKARECLEQAKIMIATHLKPNLISFNSVVASTGGSKPNLLEHLQHQLNILMKQEGYIDTALKEIHKAQKEDWNLELTELKPLKEVLKEEKGDHTPAIIKANINGLQELFVLKATQPYPWKSILALALLGVAQVVVGTLIWTCTGGAAGMGLVSEGISDLLACASAAISGTFSWAQWGIQKAISLATAIFSSGLDGIKKAFQDLKKTAESIKKITFTTFKEGFKAMGKKTALELGKGTAKMLATKLLDAAVEKWGIQNMEQYIEKKVIKSLERKMRQSKFITKALELDAKNGNNNWQQIFIDEGLAILTKTDNKLMQHLKETVSILANKGIAELGEAAGGGKNATILKTFFQGATMLKALADILLMTSEFWKGFIYQIKLKYKEELKKAIEEQVETSSQTKKEEEPGEKDAGNAAPSSIEQFSIAPEPDGEIAVAQVTGDSSYSSKVEAQGPGLLEYCPGAPADNVRLSNVFANHLKAKITNKIKAEIAHPLTSGIASWGIDKVSKGLTEDVNAALAAYQSKREGQIMCDDHANNQKDQGGNQQLEHKELPKEVQQRIEQLKNDGKGDITDIAKISQDLGRPIVIQEKDGQIYDIIGSKQQGDPIIVKYDPANGGHYAPADSKLQLPAGGKNDCLFTATYAQITAEERQKLGINSLEDFKNKHIESISRDAQSMQQLYQKATEMRNYNPDYVLEGGRKSQLENYQQESGESPGYFNHDPQNGVFHGFDRRPYCMKSKPDREKLVKADRKAHGIKKRFINGKEISISKEADMQKGSTCYCANCREESNSSSKNSASEPKSNNSYKHHTPRIPFLNPTSTNKISNQVGFATGILRQQRRMSEFDMAIAESRAALKVAQEMKKVYEANQKEQASKLAAEAKQQAEEKATQKAAEDQRRKEETTLRAAQKARRTASARRREEIRKQSEEAARHKKAENKKRVKENAQEKAASNKEQAKKKSPTQEGQKAKKARRRANQRARRKEAAKKQAEAKKQVNQGLVKQEEANIQKIAEQEENFKKDLEVKQGANPAAKRVKEKPRQQVEEKVIETRQREEEIKGQAAEAEAIKKQKEQETRRAKIRKGKQKLPQREEEEPVASAAATNFSQSLDEALNQFVNSHNQSSPEEEAIQNYSEQTHNLLQKLRQEGFTNELENQTHEMLLDLNEKAREEIREQEVAHQIKKILDSQKASSIEINQAKECLQQHRQNLKLIQMLINQLEDGLSSAQMGEVGEMETTKQKAEKEIKEKVNRKEAESVEVAKGASSWIEHNKHKLYKQLEEEEREAQKKYENSLTLQNAADEVAAYLKGIKEANFSPGAQKLRGKVLLKQIEAFKKLAKHNYRMTRQIMKDIDPIPAEMARAQLLQHKSQLTAMRNLRSQLKKACPLTPEELAACKIKVKKIAEKDDYESDTSDEDNDCSRSDLAFNKGIIKGIWRAFKETPQAIFEESKSLIKNPIKAIKNCIMLLEKMPALSAILQEISSYLDSIEGNEEAKGEEIGHFIAEQVIHLLLPSKTKVVSSLAKVTKLNKLGGKAAGIIAGELEKAGKGKKGKKGHKKGNSKDRPTIPKKSIENVLSKEKYYERARNKALELVGNLGVDSKPFFCDLPKSSAFGKIVGRQSADGKIHWRLDYDPKVGPHINVMDIRAGKKLKAKNYLIPFEGDEQLFEKLVNNLNK